MKPSGKMTADRIGGLIWIALGAAIVYGSWAMDRLTSLQIHPATAPGLVPGLLFPHSSWISITGSLVSMVFTAGSFVALRHLRRRTRAASIHDARR